DQLYLPAFKGRPEYDPAQQAVEIAALRWAEANGMGQPQLEIGPFQPSGANARSTQIRVGAVSLTVTLEERAFQVYGNCSDIDQDPPRTVPRWIVTACVPGTHRQLAAAH
ncbi:MAG TPA: hypothetical protein VL147_13045, partial [Devosia sp.]|nr:hypothetical protein [Devosia sp.]